MPLKDKADIVKLIGKKIVDIRGWVSDRDKKLKRSYKEVSPQYILFDDGKTVLVLNEQDYYTFHDCSSLARELWFRHDKDFWTRVKKDKITYPKANKDIGW